MSQLTNILQQSITLFLQYGIKSITMDDLARQLGVSKKTLYEYVENKSDLVDKVILNYLEVEKAGVSQIMQVKQTPIDQMHQLAKFGTRNVRQMNPALIFDLQKYYRNAWDKFLMFKKEFMYSCIKQNIEDGIAQGFYREDIKPEIIAKLYLFKMEALIDQSIFPVGEYPFHVLVEQYFKYHIRGISSPKGHQYLAKKDLPL